MYKYKYKAIFELDNNKKATVTTRSSMDKSEHEEHFMKLLNESNYIPIDDNKLLNTNKIVTIEIIKYDEV